MLVLVLLRDPNHQWASQRPGGITRHSHPMSRGALQPPFQSCRTTMTLALAVQKELISRIWVLLGIIARNIDYRIEMN